MPSPQFSSVQGGIYVLGKAHISRKFPQRRLWNGSRGRLIDNGPLSSFQGQSSNASLPLFMPLLVTLWSPDPPWGGGSPCTETGFDVKVSSNWRYYRQVVSLVMILQTGCKSGDDVRVHHTGDTVVNASYPQATASMFCFSDFLYSLQWLNESVCEKKNDIDTWKHPILPHPNPLLLKKQGADVLLILMGRMLRNIFKKGENLNSFCLVLFSFFLKF